MPANSLFIAWAHPHKLNLVNTMVWTIPKDLGQRWNTNPFSGTIWAQFQGSGPMLYLLRPCGAFQGPLPRLDKLGWSAMRVTDNEIELSTLFCA